MSKMMLIAMMLLPVAALAERLGPAEQTVGNDRVAIRLSLPEQYRQLRPGLQGQALRRPNASRSSPERPGVVQGETGICSSNR